MAGQTVARGPEALVAACTTRFSRRHRAWLADPAAGTQESVRVSTAPPTADRADAEPAATADWISRWRDFELNRAGPDVSVTWADRRLPGFGSVALPLRAEVRGHGAIADLAGQTDRWNILVARAARIIGLGPGQESLRRTAADTAPQWEKLSEQDMERLLDVCRWALEHPTSGLGAREIPVPGVDTKWIESRLRMIEQLVDAARDPSADSSAGAGLGLRGRDLRVRIRILDPRIEFPLRDVESPVEQLATLWPDDPGARHLVVVVENLTTFLALPDLPRTVAVFGRGYAVDAVAALPWALRAEIVYWGDLDSHGFAILDRLRHHAPHVTSVLMDSATLDAWQQFAVPDPSPTRTAPTRLTAGELDTLERLTADGDLRLEQERIPWDWAIPRLTAALHRPGTSSELSPPPPRGASTP